MEQHREDIPSSSTTNSTDSSSTSSSTSSSSTSSSSSSSSSSSHHLSSTHRFSKYTHLLHRSSSSSISSRLSSSSPESSFLLTMNPEHLPVPIDHPVDQQRGDADDHTPSDDDTDSGEADDEDDDQQSDANINLIIGSYKITSKLQATTIYQCLHILTREVFQCSIINAEQYFNFMVKYDRIKNHPGVNQIREICTQLDKNLIIYGQTFGDFHEYARNKVRLEENEAVYFFHQMVLIVHDFHNLGIILRDLKLRRFVFKDEARRKIVLESWDDSVLLTDPSNDCLSDKYGCPTYASPELVDQRITCYSGKKADTWSLGIILFAMLAGRYPFYHRIPSQLLHRIERGFYIMPDHISPQASQLIQGLLTKNPVIRMSTSDILNSSWFRLYNRHNLTFTSDSRGQQGASASASASASHSFTFPQLLHHTHSLQHQPTQQDIFNPPSSSSSSLSSAPASSTSSSSIAHHRYHCPPFCDNLTHQHHHHHHQPTNPTLQHRVHINQPPTPRTTSSRDDNLTGQLISTDQIVPECQTANPIDDEDEEEEEDDDDDMEDDDDDQQSKK